MNTVSILSLCLAILIIGGCATKELRVSEYRVSPDAPNPAKPPEEFYVIGAGDVIGINVWREPSLSGSAKVRPDGYVTLPLINELQVVGLTTAQLRKLLEEKYKDFTADPFVTIRIEGIISAEIFFVSRGRSGVFPLSGNETILQLLARMGGLGIFDDRSNVRVVRRDGDKITEYIVDYDAIIKGDLKQDILLRPGDRIIIN